MIPFEFEYHRPATAAEAVQQFVRLRQQGKQPVWYGGGTEIITRARLHKLHTGAVVDLKAIPECTVLERRGDRLVFGAAVTLDAIYRSRLWTLLGEACNRVADHTVRCKVTLGGNLAGNIKYREAVLPLLLVDAEAVVGSDDGFRTAPFTDVFDEALTLAPSEFLAQVTVPAEVASYPSFWVKRTRIDWVDYPLLSVAAVRAPGAVGSDNVTRGDEQIRVAYSGLGDYPFRSREMELALNNRALSHDDRVFQAISAVPLTLADDIHGSAEYREFVLTNTLLDVLRDLELPH